jgi:hypothetical protein
MDTTRQKSSGGLRKLLLLGAIVPPLSVALWASVTWVSKRPAGAPLYTAADLPAPPPAEGNGWVAYVAAGEPDPVALPKQLASLMDPAAPRRWADVEAHRSTLVAWSDDAAAKRALDAHAAMAAAPRFEERCPPDVDVPCPILPGVRFQHAAGAAALGQALRGDWPSSWATVGRALALHTQWWASAQSTVGTMASLSAVERDVEVAALLLEGRAAAGGAMAPEERPALDGLAASLKRYAPRPTSLSVKWEYVSMRPLVERSLASSQRSGLGITSLLVDEGATFEAFDAYFVAIVDAVEGRGPHPSREPLTGRPLWWLSNSIGKSTLDAAIPMISEPLARGAERAKALALRRDAVLAALEKARSTVPAP